MGGIGPWYVLCTKGMLYASPLLASWAEALITQKGMFYAFVLGLHPTLGK